MKDTAIVKALLKEGFFISKDTYKHIVLKSKDGIEISMLNYGSDFIHSVIQKDLEVGDASFVNISYTSYEKFLRNWEKDLKFIKDVKYR